VENRDPSNDPTRSHIWGTEPGAHRVLVFWDGGVTSRELPAGGTVVIGRSNECDISVLHPSVSRRHVAVRAGSPVLVEDLGSANGTRIGGVPLPRKTPTALEPGAVVEAGSVMIVVQTPGVASEAAPPTLPAAASPSPMQQLDRLTKLVAASGLSVILFGETGVGKEVMAERIHQGSTRAAGPLLRLNCAALPETLLESELFGHERGAFTGAVKSKPGLMEGAGGGSVFLDEVAELTLPTQAKLLRVIESREVMPLGGLHPRPIDVRFIAAANRDLRDLVEQGTFRRDLYFRLNGITLHIPPLRDRRDEIPRLAQEFVAAAAARLGAPPPVISPAALDALLRHAWTGNIRELRNTMDRAIVLSQGGRIEPLHLGLLVSPSPTRSQPLHEGGDAGLRRDVDAFERDRILDALKQAGGNQGRAAELLGVSRRTLVSRLSAYGLTKPRAGKGDGER